MNAIRLFDLETKGVPILSHIFFMPFFHSWHACFLIWYWYKCRMPLHWTLTMQFFGFFLKIWDLKGELTSCGNKSKNQQWWSKWWKNYNIFYYTMKMFKLMKATIYSRVCTVKKMSTKKHNDNLLKFINFS